MAHPVMPARLRAVEDGYRRDASHDVRHERSEAEGEKGDPFAGADALGLVGERDWHSRLVPLRGEYLEVSMCTFLVRQKGTNRYNR